MSLRSRRSSLKRRCNSSITSYNKQQRVWAAATKKLKSKQNAIPSACLFRPAKTVYVPTRRVHHRKKKRSRRRRERTGFWREYGRQRPPRYTHDDDFPDFVPSGAVADVPQPEPVQPTAFTEEVMKEDEQSSLPPVS